MEDVVFSEWPSTAGTVNVEAMTTTSTGGGVDLHGSNPWMPAYGFHQTLDRDDFLGSPDADLFLHGDANAHYVYLETIQEETSDDLQSDSDRSESRASLVGWLATDSESGSVIRISILDDSGSEREIACPAKRRRQDFNHLTISDDESSLSRSSSLLQFENLEKQCQDISNSSPSIFSNFSYDSLENQRKNNVSPDSLEQPAGSDTEESTSSSYYKTLKIDKSTTKTGKLPTAEDSESLFYNVTRSSSDTSESADSDETPRYNSCNNLKTWRSFDGLNVNNNVVQKVVKDKMSTENLSEDSGYSDNFCNGVKCNSIPNVVIQTEHTQEKEKSLYKTRVSIGSTGILDSYKKTNSYVGFDAYDGDVFQNFTTNFGVSYQDLSTVEKYDVATSTEYRSPLIDRFMRNGAAKRRGRMDVAAQQQQQQQQSHHHQRRSNELLLNIEESRDYKECNTTARMGTKIKPASSASVPNLVEDDATDAATCQLQSTSTSAEYQQDAAVLRIQHKQSEYFEESVCVSSVPNDLNLATDSRQSINKWRFEHSVKSAAPAQTSVAAMNWDIGDLTDDNTMPQHRNKSSISRKNTNDKIIIKLKHDSSSISSASDLEMSSFIREGSYLEAMTNLIEMSDEEECNMVTKRWPKAKPPLVEFDQTLLKAISETSVQSFGNGIEKLNNLVFTSTPISSQNRNVISTPNLTSTQYDCDEIPDRPQRSTECIPRKSSLINRSTSTSGMSETEDKIISPTKSFSGSTGSKGVHFCPVVSQVNWRDDSESTTERESSYSLSSTPERASPPLLNLKSPPPVVVVRPEPRKPRSTISASQPELLQKVAKKARKSAENILSRDDFSEYTFSPVAPAVSQPEMSAVVKRRANHSQSLHYDPDGVSTSTVSDSKRKQQQRYSDGGGVSSVYNSRLSPTHISHAVSASAVASAPSTMNRHSQYGEDKPVSELFADGRSSKCGSNMQPQSTTVSGSKSSRLGGFFSRIASFRFSTRNKGATSTDKNSNKAQRKQQQQNDIEPQPCGVKNQQTKTANTGQRLATKDDYIYIPLKGPTVNNNQPANDVSSSSECSKLSGKPPLPKMPPPRVVGACVKRRPDVVTGVTSSPGAAASGGGAHNHPNERRETIDPSQRQHRNNHHHLLQQQQQHQQRPPMAAQPMGLIETDLDTEVTVITNCGSGIGIGSVVGTAAGNVKTRSLMNLGAEAPVAPVASAASAVSSSGAHHHLLHHNHHSNDVNTARPHKSMEFLLDKQNLRVVEVSASECMCVCVIVIVRVSVGLVYDVMIVYRE